MKARTLEARITNRIESKGGDVFLRADFRDLGGYDQMGRALREVVKKGRLIRVGYGVYVRAVQSPFSGCLVPKGGLATLKEALQRLGVEAAPGRLELDYNAGRTTQAPTGRVVAVRSRIRRKLGYNGIALSYERARPEPR